MRLLSKKQIRDLVLYSPQHIARLEARGDFPRRVKLGQCRVGWVEDEVMEWLKARIAKRGNPTGRS